MSTTYFKTAQDFDWFKHYPAAFVTETSHLSHVELGVYRRLLDHYWSADNKLPSDPVEIVERITARLFTAVLFGSLVGLERQWHQRMAGTRTNALVAAAPAAFVMAGLQLSGDIPQLVDRSSRNGVVRLDVNRSRVGPPSVVSHKDPQQICSARTDPRRQQYEKLPPAKQGEIVLPPGGSES